MTGNLLFILIAVFASVYFSTPKPARKKMVRTVVIALSFALTFRALVSAPYKIPTGSMIPTLKIGDFIFVNKLAYSVNFDNPVYGFFNLVHELLPEGNFAKSWAEKLTTRFHKYHVQLVEYAKPQRGDIVVFAWPNDPENFDYIKRIVAVEGDVIDIKNDQLYVNGRAISKRDFADKSILSDLNDDDANFSNLYVEDLLGTKHIIREIPIRHQGRNGVCPDQSPNPDAGHGCDPYNPTSFTIAPGHIFAMGDNRDDSLDSRYWGEVPLKNVRGKALLVWLSFNPKSSLFNFGGIEMGKPRFERFGMKIL